LDRQELFQVWQRGTSSDALPEWQRRGRHEGSKEHKKAFAQPKETKEDSDISESDSSQGESHFQVTGDGLQFTLVVSEFKPRTAQLSKQAHRSIMLLDLRVIIVLDSQSTVDLICNPTLVKKIFRSSAKMQLKRNGGSMKMNLKATMTGYRRDMWYDKEATTNILALSKVMKQYRVTHDSDDRMFVVHREDEGKPNMEFRIHESGLHSYHPRDEDFHTVSGNKQGLGRDESRVQKSPVLCTPPQLSMVGGFQVDHPH
jgi:hypothetical protein